MLGSWISVFTLIVVHFNRNETWYQYLRVGVPLFVPVLYPRLNVDVNKCKQEPGSKIAQNISL